MPHPDMCVQEQVHLSRSESGSRAASQSDSSPIGPTMSPKIRPDPTMVPRRRLSLGCSCGGTMSATGLPKRVTRMGCLVVRTCSSTCRQVALNLEIAISFIGSTYTRIDHGLTIVKSQGVLY